MSGFFAVHRHTLDLDALHPHGFKILLEILARTPTMHLAEVPFRFAPRQHGESHAGIAEGFRFLWLLMMLRLESVGVTGRALLFGLVGLSGMIPNVVALRLLTDIGMDYIAAAILAIQVAIIWNFVGAELLVWRHHRQNRSLTGRFLRFAAIGETDLARVPFVIALVEFVRIGSTTATVITLIGAFLIRFLLVERLVYRRTTRQPEAWSSPISAEASSEVA